jgi:hypothetical protein
MLCRPCQCDNITRLQPASANSSDVCTEVAAKALVGLAGDLGSIPDVLAQKLSVNVPNRKVSFSLQGLDCYVAQQINEDSPISPLIDTIPEPPPCTCASNDSHSGYTICQQHPFSAFFVTQPDMEDLKATSLDSTSLDSSSQPADGTSKLFGAQLGTAVDVLLSVTVAGLV